MTTIEERVRRAHDAVTLIGAACAAAAAGIDPEDVRDAMLSAAIAAREELYWLKQLPYVVLNLPAADSEEIGVSESKLLKARIEALVLKELDEVIADHVRARAEEIPRKSKSAKKGGA